MDMLLTDTDIEAVLAGNPPHDRPNLADLSAAIERLRDNVPSQPVAWSAELAAMFDQTGGSDAPTPASEPVRRRVLRWAAGLGLAGQAVLASTGAAAAMVVGGLTGVLPDPVQRVFDDIVHRQEEPPATPPSPATARRQQTSQDAEDRREAASNGAPADQRKAESRRTSRDLTVDGSRRPSVPVASAGAEQAPPASRNTGDAGADRSGSDAPVAPKRPTTPAEDPDDDLEDAEDDRTDDLEEAEDDRTDDLEEAEDDRRDDLEEAEDDRRDDLEDADDRADDRDEDYDDAS